MTIFYKQRVKAQLKASDIAKYLDISYERYDAIEKGLVKMPTNLIDKFNELIGKGKNMNKLDYLQNEEEITRWWNEMSSKSDQRFNIQKKLKEYNIKDYNALGELTGYSSGYIRTCLCFPDKATYTFKNRMYNFLTDERNIQIPKTKTETLIETSDIYKWFASIDWKSMKAEDGFTLKRVMDESKLSSATVNKIFNKTNPLIREDALLKLKKWYNNYYKNEPTQLEIIPETTEEKCEEVCNITENHPENIIQHDEKTNIAESSSTAVTEAITNIMEHVNSFNVLTSEHEEKTNESNNLKTILLNKYTNELFALDTKIMDLQTAIEKCKLQKEIYDDILNTIRNEG